MIVSTVKSFMTDSNLQWVDFKYDICIHLFEKCLFSSKITFKGTIRFV